MYNVKNDTVLLDGKPLSTYAELKTFLDFYKADEKFCEYHIVSKLIYKLAPYGNLMRPLGFANKIRRSSPFVRLSRLLAADIDYDVMVQTPSGIKPLQRPFVWTIEQKRALIETMLKQQPISDISINIVEKNDGSLKYEIIDGKQRLSTIISFFNNEFGILVDGIEYFYYDLDYCTSDTISRMSSMPACQAIYSYEDNYLTDAEKIEWFKRINFAGTLQEIEHIQNLEK
jgi:hypothetical protein